MDQRILNRTKRVDRWARWGITGGGLLIILAVVGILVLIVQVALPLFFPARGEEITQRGLPSGVVPQDVLAVGVGPYLEGGYLVTRGGEILFFPLNGPGAAAPSVSDERVRLAPPTPQAKTVVAVETRLVHIHTLLWQDGSISVERVGFQPQYAEGGQRVIGHSLERLAVVPALGDPLRLASARTVEEGTTRLAATAGNRLHFWRKAQQTNFLGMTQTALFKAYLTPVLPSPVTALTLTGDGHGGYAGLADGSVLYFDLSDSDNPRLAEWVHAPPGGGAITALNLVLGDISLAVADSTGGLTTWFSVADASGARHLQKIHTLSVDDPPVGHIAPSRAGKTLAVLDKDGQVRLHHPTSERHLLTLDASRPMTLLGLSDRENGLLALDDQGAMRLFRIHNPHPEVSFSTLFGKVWYENYPAPAYVWQSSSASDDFEPKLSLIPLIFGTLKGTFYALLFATPLAVLGAAYAGQLMNRRLQRFVKPTVEIMSAMPSVVIGFLAALWLAPLLEHHLTAPFWFLVFLPVVLVGTMISWDKFGRGTVLEATLRGMEFLLCVPAVLLAAALAVGLDHLLTQWVFGGNFRQWLFQNFGTNADQRNSVVIAFALGFTVIPTIFTLAEDAISSVPRSYTAASLALGASRWQTVWRVILPSASPGIFAGVMVGFGRAVGETMIVLMATGNTPIMDVSVFNGMRTLSANIAVEIPEAPVDGTLYRVLFLSAVLLFSTTFIINSVAEVVRHRLRKKYGRF
ncbi:MAG: ABC transporter permease subunit [Deltaproteobacteria bacterium]|nr:ABC transporter permease subunit [Deltaproteobacteria bacterium]